LSNSSILVEMTDSTLEDRIRMLCAAAISAEEPELGPILAELRSAPATLKRDKAVHLSASPGE
jgi:hypothetical protein